MATVVEGDQRALFSIATRLTCRGALIPSLVALLYPWYVPYVAECSARWYQIPFLKSLVWLDLGLNPSFPHHKRKLNSLGQYIYMNNIVVSVTQCFLLHAFIRPSSNLMSGLLRCGTRSYELGTQWESNSLVKVW